MAGFAYKPALLAGTRHYDLDATDLICRDWHGAELWRLAWDRIDLAAFVELRIRGYRMRRLDLRDGAGNPTRAISYTGPPGDPSADPDSVTHLDLIAAILTRLHERDADFSVRVGEYGRSRLAMFVVGVLSALSAVALMVLALATGVASDKLVAGAVAFGVLLLFGWVVARANAPWRPVPSLPGGMLARALQSVAHPDAETQDDGNVHLPRDGSAR